MPKQIKDGYTILAELGAGGMATVYQAKQKALDRFVAIKELNKDFHADVQLVRRFERESKVAASLQHENIVHIYDYWTKPFYSIVMEYVDGVTLAAVIEKAGALPVDVGVMIAVQVANALEYAHMRGLIHRDIKPGNIMITRSGEVKLMDFGIAHARSLEALTLPGTLIGTPSYMSPEQILGQQLDSRSDVFSFGVVLYEMFTGTKPFSDDESRPVTAKIIKDDVLAPRKLNRDIPRGLQRVIKKCLRKKPQRRYDSMLQLATKLGKRLRGGASKAAALLRISDYLASVNVLAPAAGGQTIIIARQPKDRRRLIMALAAGVAALVVAGGALYYTSIFALLSGNAPATADPIVPSGVPPTVTQPLPVTANTPTAPAADVPDPAAPSVRASAPPAATPPASVERKKKQSPHPVNKAENSKKKKKRTTAPSP